MKTLNFALLVISEKVAFIHARDRVSQMGRNFYSMALDLGEIQLVYR